MKLDHLSARQIQTLEILDAKKEARDLAQNKSHVARARFNRAVYDALVTDKIPSKVLADKLNVSTARIYQIREEVESSNT